MFGEKLKKAVSVTLIFGMVMTGNGFTTLASSVDDLVTDSTIKAEQSEQKNYYEQMTTEYYEESTTIVKTNAPQNNIQDAKGENAPTEQVENENQENSKTDSGITEAEGFSDDNSGNNSSYEEEPEEDETTVTKNENEEETTTTEKVESSDQTTTTENIDDKTQTEKEEDETTATEKAESSDQTTTKENNINETTIVEEETTVAETQETSETVETSETQETEGTTESSETTTNETETKEIVASESDATDKVSDEEIVEASASETSEEKTVTATESDIIDKIDDIKSTKSEIEFSDETEVATASTATKSIIKVVKYIVATKSKIATTSIWKVKKFLIDEKAGSFSGQIPSEEEMNSKYLPKQVRVLVEDQLGNQRVLTINAKWDRIRVNQQSGRRVDKTPKATRAYIPSKLSREGLKIDVNAGTFAKDTINVAEVKENREFNAQVQKGINEYYSEINEKIAKNNEEQLSESLDESVSETYEEKETALVEKVNETEETFDESSSEYDETAETYEEVEKTEETEDNTEEPTETIIVDETILEEILEPTVAGFVLSDEESSEETETSKELESTTAVNVEAEGEEESTTASSEDTGLKGGVTVIENGNDAQIVNSYEVETVYEDSKIEIVSGNELADDAGLQGNLSSSIVDPEKANFAVGGELNFDSALSELANMLGEDSVVLIPNLEPVQLTAFGDGLFGSGADGTTHTTHTGNYVSDLNGVGPTFNPNQNYVIASDSDLVDYANDATKNGWILTLGNNVSVTKDIDFKKHHFYFCTNGHVLTFAEIENTKTNIYEPGRITNAGDVVITNCKSPVTSGDITGLDSSTGVPYDRRIYSTVSSTYKSVSAIEGVGNYSIVQGVVVNYIWSNVHDKIQFTGYDDDAAAFIHATASYVNIDDVWAHDLVGAKGGLMKANEVKKAVIRNNKFERNKAFMGACFNIRFKDAISKTQGTTEGLEISNNEFKQNAYAFFDYNDENPYTFGRYTYAKTEYFKVSDTGVFAEKITTGFNDTSVGSDAYTRANDAKPNYGKTYESHQYQNLGYEKTTYNYDSYIANGLILVDNVGMSNSGTLSIDIAENEITNNMPYDLCGTFHLSFNNVIADSVNGNTFRDKIKINVYKNEIVNNCQYKSSKNEGDVAAGMTISVAPWSFAKHVTIAYEDAYKMGTNSEAVPYKKAVYKNGEYGVGGILDFYNNIINYNYNNSPNPGSIAIRNMYQVDINKEISGRDSKFGTLSADAKVAKENFTAGGGAAYDFFRNGKTRVYNTIFENNNSVTKGGAVAISGERDIEFINEGTKTNPTVVFRNNYARTFGGAVFASDSKAIKFTKVDFKNNYLLSGKRWVTTMGLVDYYTNWFYGYKQGTLRKGYPEGIANFTQTITSFDELPFASSTYNNQYWYVMDEDATYKCALKSGSTTEYQWTQLDDAWTYYDETRASAQRGFVEPYLFGDTGKKVYVKRGSNETTDLMFDYQTVTAYDLNTGAIGGELENMGKGGALALMSSGATEVIFDNCDITDNISSFTGGAIYANTEKGMIRIYGNASERAEVTGNLSGRSGGFMMIENTKASLSYVNVARNRAEQGGAIFTFTDPDKNYDEKDSELYIYKTDIVENGFLKDTDKTPYEQYTKPLERYNFNYFATSGNDEGTANKGAIINDNHNYLDINNEARHTLYMADNKSNWTKLMKTATDSSFTAGGAIYTYATQVKFDTGAYVAKNTNTLYSIAGSTILTRQTTNHDLNTKEEEITFEENSGQYVFGHFSTFKARFQFYGGKIVNNNLESKASSDVKYNYIDTEPQYVGNKVYEIYTARPLSTYRKAEERSIVLGGNIMIKDNTEGGNIYNLGLEEGSQDRNYKFELSTISKLHKNAEIYLTPLEPNKLRYQAFGNSANTWEEELIARRSAASTDEWSNHGLWSDEWVEGLDSGAVVQNIFKNDLADDPLDGRVLYTATNFANNETGNTTDFGQIYLEDPNNLIAVKFELYDLDKNGEHRYESQLETQYFSQGSKVQSPLSDQIDTMKFSTDSSIRLIDIVGYSGAGNDQRFDVWDFEHNQITKGDNQARISAGNKEINIPGDADTYNVQTLYAINAMTNHRHKVCGTPVGVPCNHADGSNHDAYIYGDDGVTSLGKIGRKWATNASDKVGGNLSIEVSTLSQLMYVRQHPEYMYVLTNDLIINDYIWNRAVNGIINDTANPIENLKLCLNGHNIYINDDRDIASFFGSGCYICNCQPVDVNIHYNADATSGHNYYSRTNVLTLAYPTTVTNKKTNLSIYGNENGHIVIDGLYMPSANSNTFVNLSANDNFSMSYVDFKNIGNTANSRLSTSLLDIPCNATISDVTFENINQEVNVALGKTEHVRGQGIIRLSDNAALTGVTQSFKNVKFSNTSVNKQYSGLIVSYQTNETSTLTIENSEFINSTVGGRGAITLNQGGTEYRGNTTIRFSTFSDLNPVVSRNTAGYLGGAIYSNENYGKLTINNNTFTNCGIKEADIDYIKALKGGAIYIGECTKTGIKDSNENVIDITENTFTNCIADQGGAIYMKDVPDTNIIDAEFRRNKANIGSAVYHENTTTDRRQGNVKVTRPVFVENGLPVNTTGTYSSKGTYYVKLPTETRTTNVTFEDFYAVQNKGATSVMYVDKLYTDTPKAESVIPTSRMNVVRFIGETIIRENIGGPVLSANNSAQSENNGYIQFTDETLIQNNTTGTTYAVTAARNCAINVQFAGIATVSNNKATNGSDANIYLSERIQTNIVKNMLEQKHLI